MNLEDMLKNESTMPKEFTLEVLNGKILVVFI